MLIEEVIAICTVEKNNNDGANLQGRHRWW